MLDLAPGFMKENKERTARHATFMKAAELEGKLPSVYHERVMETLLDNLDRHLSETPTTTVGIGTFSRLSKGMIARVYPNLIADQLVSIQPMTMPDYRVFFKDFLFGSNIAPTVAGDRMDYAALKQNRNYASGVIVGETVGTGDGSAVSFTTAFHPVKTGSLTVTVAGVLAAVTSYNLTTGVITMTAAPASLATVKASYSLVMEGLGASGNATIAELNMQITSASVTATTKKILAQWTLEASQDLKAYFGEDLEPQMAEQCAWEIKFEIDRGIINDLLTGATAGNVNWSKAVPSGISVKDHYETLFHAIEDANLLIYTLRLVNATWVVTDPATANKLMKTLSFRPTQASAGADGLTAIGAGPNVFGALGERFRVIVDPLFSANTILVGYKGKTMMETGYVFSPYTLFQSETFIDPKDMQPRLGLASRQANFLISGEFYATVTVTA